MSEATLRAEMGFVDSIWPNIKEAIDTSIFAVDTSSPGVEGALKVAADIALTKRREAQAVSLPDRETLQRVVGGVLWNAANYPRKAQPYLLGTDTAPLTGKVVDAVLAALSTQPAAGGAQLIAAERERQIIEEGYDAAHDEGHVDQLARAAYCYIGNVLWHVRNSSIVFERVWPWADRYWKPTGDPVRDLTKAGALIAAAIDSIRAESAEVQS